MEKMMLEIEKETGPHPERAYELAQLMADFPASGALAGKTKLNEQLRGLSCLPCVQLYVKALADMNKFVARYFATSPMDYINRPSTPAAKSEADKLAESYKDTPLAETLRHMGEPCVGVSGARKK